MFKQMMQLFQGYRLEESCARRIEKEELDATVGQQQPNSMRCMPGQQQKILIGRTRESPTRAINSRE
jgi:hypothetical protein